MLLSIVASGDGATEELWSRDGAIEGSCGKAKVVFRVVEIRRWCY